jgi:hypothetical protein
MNVEMAPAKRAIRASLYSKNPLDPTKREIRILSVQGGGTGSGLRCSIRVISLDEEPKYNALSYVWGNASDTEPINVNGVTLPVTRGLAKALRHLLVAQLPVTLEPTVPLTVLWVDAICINQDDANERAAQVQLMGDIYSTANRVVVWLGEGTVYTDEVFDRINDNSWPEKPSSSRNCILQDDAIRLSRTMYHDLMKRRWWFRIWTRQEVILARDEPLVMCGRKLCHWKAFANKTTTKALLLADEFPSHRKTFARVRDEVMLPVDPKNSAGEDDNFAAAPALDLLRDLHRAGKLHSFGFIIVELAITGRATIPHDYVYGLIGLAPAALRDSFTVDYTRTSMACFHDLMVAEWTDEPTFAFDILESCPLPPRPLNGQWPSWVPDLANKWRRAENDMYSARDWTFGDRWRDTWPGDSTIKVTEAGRVVCLPGVTIGVVQYVQTIGKAGATLEEINKLCKSIDDFFIRACNQGLAKSTLCSSTCLKAVAEESHPWSTIFRQIGGDEYELIPVYSNEAVWRMVVDGVLAETLGLDAWDDQTTMLEYFIPRIKGWMNKKAARRRLVSTKEGLVGLSVPSVRVGDEVVFMHGATCPFVLRRDETPGHHALVGGAFFSGLKDLERLDKLCEEGMFKHTTFSVC